MNSILKKVCKEVYDNKNALDPNEKIYCRIETVSNKVFCEIWFQTVGCQHDKTGGCTICNYGKGNIISDEEVLYLIEEKLKECKIEIEQLVISPSGSMFDNAEVSKDLRENIFRLANKYSCNKFITESRADTITHSKLEVMRKLMPKTNISIEIGVESSNDWVLENSINKNMNIDQLQFTIQFIKNFDFEVTSNITVGSPFLTSSGQVRDAVNSVNKMFELGVDTVVLFPIHIKPGTLVNYLYENGDYECVSLWALIEVLKRVDKNKLKNIHISWYKNYYTDNKKVILSPTTCEKCYSEIIIKLDEYKNNPSKKTLNKLAEYECDCKNKQTYNEDEFINIDQLRSFYNKIIDDFNIPKLEAIDTFDEIIGNQNVY